MNCSLKTDRHKKNRCVHIEVMHLIRRTATTSLSHDREDLLHVLHIIWRNTEIGVANICHCLRLPSLLSLLEFLGFLDILGILGRQVSLYLQTLQDSSGVPGVLLSRQVSLCIRPAKHLFAILENSTLPHDWNFLRQVSLNLTNLFDKMLWVSLGFSNLSRQRRPSSSSSALTLPRSCCPLPVLASISPSFWSSWSSWNSECSRESWNGWCLTNEEDFSTHHVWNCPLSICLQVGVWYRHTWFEFWWGEQAALGAGQSSIGYKRAVDVARQAHTRHDPERNNRWPPARTTSLTARLHWSDQNCRAGLEP